MEDSNQRANVPNTNREMDTLNHPSQQYLEAYLRPSNFMLNNQQQLQNLCDPAYQATLQMMASEAGPARVGASSFNGLPQYPSPLSPSSNLNIQGGSMAGSLAEQMSQTARMHPSSVHFPPLCFPTARIPSLTIPPRMPLVDANYFSGSQHSAFVPIVASANQGDPFLQASRTALGASILDGVVPRQTVPANRTTALLTEQASLRTAIRSEESSVLDAKVTSTRKDAPSAIDSTMATTSKDVAEESLKPSAKASFSSPKKQAHVQPNRDYIEKVHMLDVLCGRGGRSNRHPGNQIFRRLVLKMKDKYRIIGCNDAKKDLSMEIVQKIHESGGRFIKMDQETGKFYLLTLSEARKKTSQALREIRSPIWT